MSSANQSQREKIYNALCLTLSERIDQVDWVSFSADDWSRFGKMAQKESVAPLIHWTFKHSDTSKIDIPTPAKAQLMAAYYNTTAQNQVMYQELEKILEALNAADIPVIVLKGAALASTVYPEIDLRPMGDLDLLVLHQNIDLADRAIRALGYSDANPLLSFDLNRRIGHHISLRGGPKGTIEVEIHWNLIAGEDDWRSVPPDWFWEQAIEWKENRSSFILSPTSTILYLAAHNMLQHGEAQVRLIWLYDLDLLIRHYQNSIEWEQLHKQSREFKWETALRLSLNEIMYYFNSPIPQNYLDLFAKDQDQRTTDLILRKTRTSQTALDRNVNRILALSWSARVDYLITKLFPSPAFMRWFYHPETTWLLPLYYPYRWFTMMRDLFFSR